MRDERNAREKLRCPPDTITEVLRGKIVKSLERQGFSFNGLLVELPKHIDKEGIRRLHGEAVQSRIKRAKKGLIRHESTLLTYIADGRQIMPNKIQPQLIEVKPGTENELLFRYAALHWSIPVSSGYGRRLRFLVFDDSNGKLIGLFGLGDPVFSLASRDNWVGWSKETRREKLTHVMDAFVLGAVPPYSHLLGGKLVAMLVTSDEVRNAFRRKYVGRLSLIRQKKMDGRLVLVTTTSALGRSSIYNRLKYKNRNLFQRVGFTAGSGEFHFSNGLYSELSEFARLYCKPSAKQDRWGYISFSELKSIKVGGWLEIDCELEDFWRVRKASEIEKIRKAHGWKKTND